MSSNNYKNIEISWIFETEISNMNAGEGSSNLKELKTYNNGLPYISGQSMRHALRQSMKREHENCFKCTPEFPCGDIKKCWTCDLFGFLLPSSGSKRWSPIKASPALGQIRNNITTDLIFRNVADIKCPRCKKKIYPLSARDSSTKTIKKGSKLKCPFCDKDFEAPYDIRQALAYKQLTNNIYKTSLSIDLDNIGVEKVQKISDDKMDGVETITSIESKEKYNRISAILNGIYNLADFANQSREMVNASPDFIIISLQSQYNHRLASVLKIDENGNINIPHFESIIKEILTDNDNKIYMGLISGIITNEKEFKSKIEEISNNNTNCNFFNSPKTAIDECLKEIGDKYLKETKDEDK